jgi:CheY-like chemotaxis protein
MHKFVEVQPNIVLVDVELTGTSGYQICEMIKQDEATKDIPLLLLVGSFVLFDHDEAERVQADGFVTKPFHSVRDLVIRVNELLGREVAVPVGAAVASSAGAETADIEDLYRDSFAVTAEIEEFDTLEDLLGGAEMDDELIETSKPAVDKDVEEFVPVDALATTITTPVPPAEAETAREEETGQSTPKFVFEDTPATPGPTLEEDPAAGNADELIKDLSPELIDSIAKVVIDRMSDRVIREVAKDAVPRIAEKLMREALDAESRPK